jgi:hypothetical protein
MLVFVVAKNTSPLLRIVSGEAFRAGCAIAGAEAWLKPNSLSILYGPTTRTPIYKTKTQHPKQLLVFKYHTLRP